MIIKDQVHAILNGMDKDYDIIRASVPGKSESIFIKEITAMLPNHEKRRKNMTRLIMMHCFHDVAYRD